MRVAVVGCGYWGKNLVRTFAQLDALATLCDENTEAAEKLSQQYGVPTSSFSNILADPSIEGVVIAASAISHTSLVAQALRASKHVFVEKPLALCVEEGQKLCDLADVQKKILMVGHLLHYHPAFLALQCLVQEEKLGTLQYVYANRLSLGKIRTEENVLWSFAPHDLSMILGLVGDLPEQISATSTSCLNPPVADFVTVHLSFKNGVKAHVFVSWLHPIKEQKLVVVGEKGMAIFNDRLPWAEKLQLFPAPIQWERGVPSVQNVTPVFVPCEEAEPLQEEGRHFLDCMEKGIQPRTSGQEGLRVLQLLSAAEASIQAGKAVFL